MSSVVYKTKMSVVREREKKKRRYIMLKLRQDLLK